jgi:hypothetical protein
MSCVEAGRAKGKVVISHLRAALRSYEYRARDQVLDHLLALLQVLNCDVDSVVRTKTV